MKHTVKILAMILCTVLAAALIPTAAFAARDNDVFELVIGHSGCTHDLSDLPANDTSACHTHIIDGWEIKATSGDGWSYDAVSRTLTLDGYSGSGFWMDSNSKTVSLTVKLNGVNTVEGLPYGSEPDMGYFPIAATHARMTIQGPGTLNINGYQGINPTFHSGSELGNLHITGGATINCKVYRTGIMATEMIVDSGCAVIANTTKADKNTVGGSSNPIVTQHTRCNGTLIATNAYPEAFGIASGPNITIGPNVKFSVGMTASDVKPVGIVDKQTVSAENEPGNMWPLPSQYGDDTWRYWSRTEWPYMEMIEAGYTGGGTVTTPPPADPLDTASSWARPGITEAIGKGFVPADLQNNYTNVITRQEFCRMAISWLEYATGKNIDAILAEKGVSRNTNAFSDTQDPNILAAYALGITGGTTAPTATIPGKFTPDGQFNREQAATMIMNICKAYGANVANPPASGFTDMGSVASWAVNGVNFCYANKIMNGTSTTPLTFSPATTYSRQESILTFNNIKPDTLPGVN